MNKLTCIKMYSNDMGWILRKIRLTALIWEVLYSKKYKTCSTDMGKNKKSKNCTEVGIQVETTNNILLKTKELEMEIPINENPFL